MRKYKKLFQKRFFEEKIRNFFREIFFWLRPESALDSPTYDYYYCE